MIAESSIDTLEYEARVQFAEQAAFPRDIIPRLLEGWTTATTRRYIRFLELWEEEVALRSPKPSKEEWFYYYCSNYTESVRDWLKAGEEVYTEKCLYGSDIFEDDTKVSVQELYCWLKGGK